MKSHQFRNLPNSAICSVCYKPASQHTNSRGQESILSEKENSALPAASNEPAATDERTDTAPPPPDLEGWIDAWSTNEKERITAEIIEERKKREVLEEDTAEIYRPNDVIRMAQIRHLPGRQIAEIMLAHEQFVCLEFNTKPNWDELYLNHFIEIEKKIEAFKAKLIASRGQYVRKRVEEATKLTPEEREQYKRDARKMEARLGVEGAQTAAKKEWKAQLRNLCKVSGLDAESASKHLSDLYQKAGKEIPQ